MFRNADLISMATAKQTSASAEGIILGIGLRVWCPRKFIKNIASLTLQKVLD